MLRENLRENMRENLRENLREKLCENLCENLRETRVKNAWKKLLNLKNEIYTLILLKNKNHAFFTTFFTPLGT